MRVQQDASEFFAHLVDQLDEHFKAKGHVKHLENWYERIPHQGCKMMHSSRCA